MNQCLVNEIKTFNNSMIPLIQYPYLIKELRNKADNYIKLKIFELNKMLDNKEISKEEYNQLTIITEYERQKYHKLIDRK